MIDPKISYVAKSSHRRATIGFLTTDMRTSNAQKMWHGAVDAAQENEVNLVCFVGEYLHDSQRLRSQGNVLYQLVHKHNIDGLVIRGYLSSVVDLAAELHFYERYASLPMVVMGRALKGIPHTLMDSYGGMREAIVHLVEAHGYRRLAFIRGPRYHDPQERYRAYCDVIRDYGLSFESRFITPPAAGWHDENGQVGISMLYDRRKIQPDAIVAVSDTTAQSALRALQQRGLRIPEDVALIGFDNADSSRWVTPPLTSVAGRFYDQGRLATQMVLDLLADRPVPEEVVLPTRFIPRQSCGCVTMADRPESESTVPPTIIPQIAVASKQAAPIEKPMAMVNLKPKEAMTQLTACFFADAADPQSTSFLTELDLILSRTLAAGGDIVHWQQKLIDLRPLFQSPLLSGQALERAELLWQQALLLVGQRLQQEQALQRLQVEQRSALLQEISQALITTFDLNELMDLLAQQLPRLGIPSFYLSLYEQSTAEKRESGIAETATARLVLAYTDKARLQWDEPPCFPAHHLVPKELLPQGRCYDLVVEPLYFQDEQLGFALFEMGPREGSVYDMLRGQLSSALKGAQLFAQNLKLYQEAQAARQVAEEADQLKSRFLSTVSHELRTPLNLLVGLSEMLLHEHQGQRPPLPEPYRQDLTRIHVGARHLDGLIRDVLDLTRSQIGQLRLIRKPLNLGDVLTTVAVIGQQLALDKGLTWAAQWPADLPPILGDETRLQQVILNLISNAIKFTAEGQVTLRADVQADEIKVEVQDTGLGIPLEDQTAIFDEFRQSERTITRGYAGLGLGLAVCRQLVTLHEGQIGVISSGEEKGGSTFFFTLPIAAHVVTISRHLKPRKETVLLLTQADGSGTRLVEHLTSEGFQIEVLPIDTVPDWQAQILASPPGAILLDFQPSSGQGWELLKALKDNPATQMIPVLFYTLFQAEDSGALLDFDYLTKPVGLTALTQALARQQLTAHTDPADQVVLVVDDDPGTLRMHSQAVQTQLPACRVLTASNGQAALALMRQQRPDLVLLDLIMPELDGFGVLRAMHEDAALRDVPAIVLTAQALTESTVDQLNQGVAAVLAKGVFNTAEMLSLVEKALARNSLLGTESQRTVRKAMAYIHEHFSQPLSRQIIADHIGLSQRHLTRCFQDELGISPMAYLNRYRIKQAKSLLADSRLNVTEVALAVGFNDSSYFGRVFHREVGLTPGAYQRAPK